MKLPPQNKKRPNPSGKRSNSVQDATKNRSASKIGRGCVLQVSNLSFTYEPTASGPTTESIVTRDNAKPSSKDDESSAETASVYKNFELQSFSLKLNPGQRIGLFGPVGSGKSTIFALISRIYQPPINSIFFDGQDILAIDPQILRTRIGYALQSPQLFSASIKHNMTFGLGREIAVAELEKAAEAASILAEIENFEHGWETEIGERGVRLSGGQKQRLAIARLLLRQPEIMLLDDVLSAVDHQTERVLVDTIARTEAATIIASHRPTVLRTCDEIVMLNDGKTIDRGTYEELAERHSTLRGV